MALVSTVGLCDSTLRQLAVEKSGLTLNMEGVYSSSMDLSTSTLPLCSALLTDWSSRAKRDWLDLGITLSSHTWSWEELALWSRPGHKGARPLDPNAENCRQGQQTKNDRVKTWIYMSNSHTQSITSITPTTRHSISMIRMIQTRRVIIQIISDHHTHLTILWHCIAMDVSVLHGIVQIQIIL